MTLQRKVVYVILATTLALLVVQVTASTILLQRNFAHLEQQNVNDNLQRAANAIDRQFQALDAAAADWAIWDDTFAFMADPSQAYVEANLGDATFDYLRVNLIAFVDTEGRVVLAKAYDLNERIEAPVSRSLFEHLSDRAVIGHDGTDSRLQCMLALPEAPLMVASRPITTSQGEGPVRGAVVMGRYLDDQLLRNLGETTLLHVSAYSMGSLSAPDDVIDAMRFLVNDPKLVKPVNDDLIAGYLLANTSGGEPYLVIKIEMPRPIHAQANTLLTTNYVSIAIGWLVFLLVILVFLRRVVLSRVHRLSRAVVAVGESSDLTMRVPADGHDELGVLGEEINSTFAKLLGSEAALRQSEKKYAALVENNNDGIAMVDAGSMAFANRRLCEMTGRTMGELIGLPPLDLVSPDDRAVVAENFQARMKGGNALSRYETTLLHKDGHAVPVEVSGTVVEIDGRRWDMVVLRDISGRKWAQKRLGEQQELIDRMVAATPDPVLVVGEGQRIELANRPFRELFKLGSAELEGRTAGEVLTQPALLTAIAKGFQGIPVEETQVGNRPDGGELVLHVRVIKMKEDEVLVLLHDVTEDFARRDRLLLTDRLASVGEMASGLAHELNNPLTGVIGLSQLLLADGLPPDVRQDVQDINKEAQRAAAIVKNLLMFARKHAPVRQPTQINTVITDVLKLRAYEQNVNNIAVSTRLDPDLPPTMADYFQLQQVFLNIVLNAEQAMAEAHGRGQLVITSERSGADIKVSIVDDGPGISAENLPRVFDPFFTTKEVGKGTGLGLSICFGIVTAHGGRIHAESAYGKGATFIVEIPIKDEV